MIVEIINFNTESCECIRVDRKTLLGNPFLLKEESDRDLVCDAHKVYLWAIVNGKMSPRQAIAYTIACFPTSAARLKVSRYWKPCDRETFLAALDDAKKRVESENLPLGCWCAPKRCHAQSIGEILFKK